MNNQEQPSVNSDRKIPKKRAMRQGCVISKKLKSHFFDLNVFLMVVWILSQLTLVLKLQQKNLHGQKSTVWENCLNTLIFTY